MAKNDRISIAVIAVPASAAQPVVNQVVASGVKAILNFSPGPLSVPADVKLKSVDLTQSLETLSFYLAGTRPTECEVPNASAKRPSTRQPR